MIYHDDMGDSGDDQYHRIKSDIDLMDGLGLRAYRFLYDSRGSPSTANWTFTW